jgi:hypothetical protein
MNGEAVGKWEIVGRGAAVGGLEKQMGKEKLSDKFEIGGSNGSNGSNSPLHTLDMQCNITAFRRQCEIPRASQHFTLSDKQIGHANQQPYLLILGSTPLVATARKTLVL